MKTNYYTIFLLIIMFSLVIADDIGTYKVNQEMQITNYCQTGDCSFINLTSLEYPNGTIIYPNTAMTQNGQTFNYSFTPTIIGEYTFVTTGDPSVTIYDSDTFNVTYSGKDTFIGINIILLLFFSSILLGVVYLNRKVNYEKWYSSILNKYKYKNYFKMTTSMVGYNLMKNTFGIYYLVGFPIMIILTDIVLTYNILPLIGFMEISMYIYSWGVLLIGLMLGGQLQEFIVTIVDDIKNLNWGFSSGK